MRVLLLASSLAGSGGIQRYTVNLERALKDLLGDEDVRCLPTSMISGLDQHHKLSRSEKARFLVRALLLAGTWKPQLVICSHLAVGPVARLIAGLLHIPYMVVVHGIEAWGRLSKTKEAALLGADRVIVTSAFSQQQLVKQHAVKLEKLVRLPCMFDEGLLNTAGCESNWEFLSSDQPMILTVARMDASERYKGHEAVLRALPKVISRVPDLKYVIVGDGDDRERLQMFSETLGLRSRVAFTGSVSDSELAALYRRSQVFILPARTVVDSHDSKGEGFGIVYLEAMAFAKPVIGPDYGAPTEFIRHRENGLLVAPGDTNAVANALLELLENPEEAHRLGEAGRRLVKERYSYQFFRDQLQVIIGDLCASGSQVVARPCES